MKIAARFVAAAVLIGSACSSATSETADTDTTAVVTTTSTSTTTVASTTSETTTTTTLSPEEAISFEILEHTEQYTSLIVFDVSGRNVADISFGGTPDTLNPRPIYVYIKRATNPDQSIVTDRAVRLQVAGGYHNGGNIVCPYNTVDTAVMCVGFARMDNSKFTLETYDFRDIPNHPADVSVALDVLLANPQLTSPIDPEQIFYFGASMGGITGSLFVDPDFRDDRIEAIVSFVGGFPFWIDGMADRANYDAGPPILMINKMKDSVITYEFARLSFQAAQGSPNVELISVFEGEHADFVTCPAVAQYQVAWIAHQVSGGPAPDPSVFDDSDCAAFGPQEGGTTGLGPRDDLFPDEAKAQFAN
jgi:hypothetical protein